MKKTLYFVFAMAFAVSCNLLKEEPTTRLLNGSAFDSELALEAQMFGIYGTLSNKWVDGNNFYYFQCATPLVHWKGTRSGLLFEQGLRGTLYKDQSTGMKILSNIYATIYKCNAFLSGLETSPVDASYKTEVEAEARFIRAVMYYQAVRMFGDVPLHLKPIMSDAEAYVKRTSYLKVYEQIISDLKFASNNMRTPERQTEVTGRAGRVSRGAAMCYLSSVYLQIASMLQSPDDQAFGTIASGEVKPDFNFMGITSAEQAYRLALSTADAVIDSGYYELEPDYRTLFNFNPEDPDNGFFSRERVFVLQNTPNGGASSTASLNTLPAYFILGYGTPHEIWTENARTLTHASTPGLVRPGRYVFQKWARTYGGPSRVSGSDFFYTGCNDPRLDASYIYNEYYTTANESSGASYASPTKTNVYPMTNGSEQAFFKKYFCPQFDQDAGYADFYVFRYAEIFLIAAEASAELDENGNLGDAYDYIEKLHARARASADVPSAEPGWERGCFSSKDELVEAIFWERVFELGGEGHEWFDSHRKGAKWLLKTLYEPVHEFLNEHEQISYRNTFWYNEGYELPLTVENTRCGLLCEYPQYEILYNQALTEEDQNFFNQSKAHFNVGANGKTNNESYDGDEENIVW